MSLPPPATAQPLPAPRISAVVPTLGSSPWLLDCLAALRRQAGVPPVEIILVDQAPEPIDLPAGLADQVLRPGSNLGFAGGTNLGLAAARGDLLATINDDALVAPDWLAILAAALDADPAAAAAQGTNLQLPRRPAAAPAGPAGSRGGHATSSIAAAAAGDAGAPLPGIAAPEPAAALPDKVEGARGIAEAEDAAPKIDGCGLGWNRWWQAIQLRHDDTAGDSGDNPPPPAGGGGPAAPPAAAAEIFGVSATAALFRRAALRQVAPTGDVFDPRLISYYEDAELAGRLRAAGWRALTVPAARALHAGSASGAGRAASRRRWRLIYGNRYLAAARLLGRAFWLRLPVLLARDLLDARNLLWPTEASQATGRDRERLAGIAAGLWRALRLLPAFVHRGRPALSPAEIARLSRAQNPRAGSAHQSRLPGQSR